MESAVPTKECFEELGALRAEVDALKQRVKEDNLRIAALEHDKVRLTTIGGLFALLLTGLGVLFADPIRHLGTKLLGE